MNHKIGNNFKLTFGFHRENVLNNLENSFALFPSILKNIEIQEYRPVEKKLNQLIES
jgi:hypothetical protein